VKAALQSLGAEINIWRVAIKPGKPFLFATASPSGGGLGRLDKCAVFGVPGNSVSAFVTFLRFVQPAVLKMMGAAENELEMQSVLAELTVDVDNKSDRALYVRGRFEHGKFQPGGLQESHALFGLSRANALVRLAPGERIKGGTVVRVQLVWL
jgi:molybdopterin molybdotransferase